MTRKSYNISTTDGRRHVLLCDTYYSLDAAMEALRQVMGWDEIWLSGPFTIDNGGDGWCAYPSYEELESDALGDGAYAPRIEERATRAAERHRRKGRAWRVPAGLGEDPQ